MATAYNKGKDIMFQPNSFNLTNDVEKCKEEYDVSSRSRWISTYNGGQDSTYSSNYFLYLLNFIINLYRKKNVKSIVR